MTYTKTQWQDRQVTSPLTYTVTSPISANTPFTLIPAEGTIVNAGTPLSSGNLNNIEAGIADVDTRLTAVEGKFTSTYTNLTLQNGATVNNSRPPKFIIRGGMVYVYGEISGGIAPGTIFATFPAGARHNSYAMNFATAVANSATVQGATISVNSSGQMSVIVAEGTSGICLNGIAFPAEQ